MVNPSSVVANGTWQERMAALDREGQRLVAELVELVKHPKVYGDPEFVRLLETAYLKAKARISGDSTKIVR